MTELNIQPLPDTLAPIPESAPIPQPDTQIGFQDGQEAAQAVPPEAENVRIL